MSTTVGIKVDDLLRERIRNAAQNLVGVDALLLGSVTQLGRRNEGKDGFLNSQRRQAVNATVAIEVNNIVALSNQTYQIDWTEYERDRKGKEVATRRFRGIATVAITAPQDEATIRLNPIGLYVKDFDWTAQL